MGRGPGGNERGEGEGACPGGQPRTGVTCGERGAAESVNLYSISGERGGQRSGGGGRGGETLGGQTEWTHNSVSLKPTISR